MGSELAPSHHLGGHYHWEADHCTTKRYSYLDKATSQNVQLLLRCHLAMLYMHITQIRNLVDSFITVPLTNKQAYCKTLIQVLLVQPQSFNQETAYHLWQIPWHDSNIMVPELVCKEAIESRSYVKWVVLGRYMQVTPVVQQLRHQGMWLKLSECLTQFPQNMSN